MSPYREGTEASWVSEPTKERLTLLVVVGMVVGGVCFLGAQIRSCTEREYEFRAGAGYHACVEACGVAP